MAYDPEAQEGMGIAARGMGLLSLYFCLRHLLAFYLATQAPPEPSTDILDAYTKLILVSLWLVAALFAVVQPRARATALAMAVMLQGLVVELLRVIIG